MSASLSPIVSAAYAAANQILKDCTHAKMHGNDWCADCWNRQVYARRAARKLQLSERPRCESCGRGAVRWDLAGVGLCGRCKARAAAEMHRRLAPAGWLALSYHPSRSDVLDAAHG